MKKDGTQVCSLVKGTVHASVKKNSYVVYVHLDQSTGVLFMQTVRVKQGKEDIANIIGSIIISNS